MAEVKSRIFLDYNATSPMLAEVKKQLFEIYEKPLNASSVHGSGRDARFIVENARREIKRLTGASDDKYRLVFTSSGTEANNMILKCCKVNNIIVSAIEHVSVLSVIDGVKKIKVNKTGVVCLQDLREKLAKCEGKTLVSVMLANNETGVIQQIEKIAKLVHENDNFLHVDAVQGFGKIDADMQKLGADAITISAHKIGGLQGAAALIFDKKLRVESLLCGGSQEMGYRAGTENVAAIHAFGVAAKVAIGNLSDMERVRNLRDELEEDIKAIDESVTIAGEKAERLPNTSYVSMPFIGSETQLMHFDLAGFEVSAGSACSSGKIGVSHVLQEMELSVANFIRISIGAQTTKEELNKFVKEWQKLNKNNVKG